MEFFMPDEWNNESYNLFRKYLSDISNPKLKNFNSKLIPNTPLIYGIPTPQLRQIAKIILKTDYKRFLELPKTNYHEEIIIDGLVRAGASKSYENIIQNMKIFIPQIYNWAINDTVVFKHLRKYSDKFIDDSCEFIYSSNPWSQRYGLLHLMNFCLTDEYIDSVLDKVDSINSDFYYVQMMQAWLIATAAAKQSFKTIRYLTSPNNLSDTVKIMTKRKIRDSHRISPEIKNLFS